MAITMDKAIITLNSLLTSPRCRWEPDNYDAIKLGKEALRAYKKSQDAGWYPPGYKLPGETKD